MTTSIYNISNVLFSSSSQSQLLTPAPEQNLLGVMGVSDWDFLCPPPPPPAATGPGGEGEREGTEAEGREEREAAGEGQGGEKEDDTTRRPSLDDFDGEIAVFQVK